MAHSELASTSEPSGLFPFNFLLVISDMHKNLFEEHQDPSYLSNVLKENIFFLLERFISLIFLTWFQMYRWKSTLRSCRFGHCYCWRNFKISNRKQPRPLADTLVNYERPAQVSIFQQWLYSTNNIICMVWVLCSSNAVPGSGRLACQFHHVCSRKIKCAPLKCTWLTLLCKGATIMEIVTLWEQ